MSYRVEFVVCELGRQSDPLVLHLYAALAEKERSMISARTKPVTDKAIVTMSLKKGSSGWKITGLGMGGPIADSPL
jgi:hypothetical protein